MIPLISYCEFPSAIVSNTIFNTLINALILHCTLLVHTFHSQTSRKSIKPIFPSIISATYRYLCFLGIAVEFKKRFGQVEELKRQNQGVGKILNLFSIKNQSKLSITHFLHPIFKFFRFLLIIK